MARRGRPTRIEGLPAPVRDAFDALLRSGVTQAEILRRLNPEVEALGEAPISRSGLHRHTLNVGELDAEVREVRAVTSALVAKFGEEPTGEVGQLTVEVLRILATKAALRARQLEMDDAEDLAELTGLINELALATERLERAATLGRKREREMREALARRAEREAKRRGLSSDRAADLREALARAA